MAQDKENQSAAEENDKKGGRSRMILLTSAEGRLFLVGVGLALAYSVWLGVKVSISPEESQKLIGMTATGSLFGRAAGLAFGYSAGMGHGIVIAISALIETVFVLIFFPLFVFSWRRLLVFNRLKNFFERIRSTAEANADSIRRYGPLGLFVFVWFPFWMTGPLVGAVIGFMLGIRLWLNMTVVLAGTYVAIFCWAFFLRRFFERVSTFGPYAAVVIVAAIIAVFIAGHLLHGYRNRHEN